MNTETKLDRLIQTLVAQGVVTREDLDNAFAQEDIIVSGVAISNATPAQRLMLQVAEEEAERYGVTIEDVQDDLDERIRLRDARASTQ
jgi:hypothetical protein